jgi:hypothetical protein
MTSRCRRTDTAIPVLSSLLCVVVTSSFRGHVAEVAAGQQQGLGHHRSVNRDSILTLATAGADAADGAATSTRRRPRNSTLA